MRARIRWLSLSPGGTPLKQVAEQMLARQYGQSEPIGFHIEEVRRDRIKGSFLERVEWDDAVDDPTGASLPIHRLEVRQVRFRLRATKPELELVDPPRSLQAFAEHFSECTGKTTRFSDISIAPDLWLSQLEKRVSSVTVTNMTVSGVTLSANTHAAIVLAGTEDVRTYVKRFTNGQPAAVERLVVSFATIEQCRVELLPNARALVLLGGESTIDMLRETLRASQTSEKDVQCASE